MLTTDDFVRLFSQELHALMCEVFPAHGIETMPDDEYEEMVIQLTTDHFWPSVIEYRRMAGISSLPRMRSFDQDAIAKRMNARMTCR